MKPEIKEKLIKMNTALVSEGETVIGTEFDSGVIGAPLLVDQQSFHRWWAKVRSFGYQLGAAAKPWKDALRTDPERNTSQFARRMVGTLEAILHELENDHLETFTQLVRAETLADLIDQGLHLHTKGYHVAAGVIGRAALEQHLRNACDELACTPRKAKPTINDYNQALYGQGHFSKTRMKHIDLLASIGNSAAHVDPGLTAEDIAKLLEELPMVVEATST